MPFLDDEVRHLVHITDLNGADVTGLTDSDFTIVLERISDAHAIETLALTVSVEELDDVAAPGDYLFYYTPTTNEGAGLYSLQITEGAFADSQGLSHEFQDEVEEGASDTGSYLTSRAAVKTAGDIDGTTHDSRIDALLSQVTTLFETLTSRTLIQDTLTETRKGDGVAHIVLAEYPVASVTSVHVSTDAPRVFGSDELLVASDEYVTDLDAAIVTRLDGGVFPEQAQAVQVVYVAGYSPVPADLQRAAIETILAKLYRGAGKSYHLKGENIGEGQVNYLVEEDVPKSARLVVDNYRRVA